MVLTKPYINNVMRIMYIIDPLLTHIFLSPLVQPLVKVEVAINFF